MAPLTQSGLDTLPVSPESHPLDSLRNRCIGLLTNHTGKAANGQTTLEILEDLGLKVVALFSPEHGFAGKMEGPIASSRHGHLTIHSLYGETRRPTEAMLSDLDVLVCDLQDVGARFYTYSTTIAYCLEECARLGLAIVVLDRPNPLGGDIVEGPLCEVAHRSFIGYLDIPVRHGMTLGELMALHKVDRGLDVELQVIRAAGWKRSQHWPETGLAWPVPSPNLPDWQSAHWYPGTCLLEFSKVSVGRGTDAPFQIIGAPWVKPEKILRAMRHWPAEIAETFTIEALDFTPSRGEHEGVPCRGIRLGTKESVTSLRTVPLGLCLLAAFFHTHEEFTEENLNACLPLLGSSEVLQAIKENDVAGAIDKASYGLTPFMDRRASCLLYD